MFPYANNPIIQSTVSPSLRKFGFMTSTRIFRQIHIWLRSWKPKWPWQRKSLITFIEEVIGQWHPWNKLSPFHVPFLRTELLNQSLTPTQRFISGEDSLTLHPPIIISFTLTLSYLTPNWSFPLVFNSSAQLYTSSWRRVSLFN